MAKKRSTGGSKGPTEVTSPASRQARSSKAYWLVKSEPEEFSIEDLAEAPNQTTHWDGVRNYQARNILRDEMKQGDLVLYYHSNANPPGVVGIARVVREGYPDHTAFDPDDPHYDPKSTPDEPRWFMVDLQLVEKFPRVIPLPELKQIKELDGMMLLRRGSRLSVQPVASKHFKTIKRLAGT